MKIKLKKKELYFYIIFVVALIVALGFIFFSPHANTKTDLSKLNNNSLFPTLGPENAIHTVVEFADFQCPWCAVASGMPKFAKDAAKKNPSINSVLGSALKVQNLAKSGKVKFIYVPMSFVGQESVYATEAALCAKDQNKFWEMHDAIFTTHDGKENNGKFSKDNLKKIAQDIEGLNTTKFNNCLEKDQKLSEVKKIESIALNYVQSTPTFFVDGKKVPPEWDKLSKELN